MAIYTQKLNAVQSAMVNSQSPSRNWHGTAQLSFYENKNEEVTGYNFCLFSFENLPVSMRKKKYEGLELYVYLSFTTIAERIALTGNNLSKPFSQDDVTFFSADIKYHAADVFEEVVFEQENFTGTSKLLPKVAFYVDSFKMFQQVIQNGVYVALRLRLIIGNDGGTNCSVYTHLSAHPPYLNIVFSDYKIVISASNASPSSGYINKRRNNIFKWSFGQTQTIDPVKQSSAKFRWRPVGETSYTEIRVNGSNQEIEIPANTFTADNIQWQIVVTSDDNVEGEPSEWFTLTTVDSIPSAKPLSPVNIMVDGSMPVEFRWQHIIDTGSPQSQYDLEYSADNGLTWQMLQSEETSDTFALVPENTLPAGNLLWRVRTYNADNVPGDYSEAASFVVRAAPQAPVISSVTAAARPVVRWQSVGQQAFEVSVTDADGRQIYTTGETASTDKEQKVMEYLTAGDYTVGVRVWNIYSIVSPWSYAAVTVPALSQAAPALTARRGKDFVRLNWTAGNYAYYYLLRDGEPIAKLAGTEYLDYTALGTHTYVVRGITINDQFKDSEPAKVTLTLEKNLLAPADALPRSLALVYHRGSEPKRSENLALSGQPVFAAGRKLPFYETNGQLSRDWTFTYSARTREEYDALAALVSLGKTVLYRGKDGTKRWLMLTGLQTTADFLSWDYTLTASEVDYIETIDYD